MIQNKESFQKNWPKIVAKAWSDPTFKKRLMENPQEVLESQGIEIPPGTHLVIHESTKNTYYLSLPMKPTGELSEEKLQGIAAAGVCSSGSPCG